ncbi:MAG: FIST C-terminal domain-containing protein [Methylobacillus sp.]|jgi:hypothetical protein|nr:FIST C-terminal domain-containing protein [Methylobacillus sp.]
MLIRQEALNGDQSLKDLPKTSPLPSASLVLAFGSVKRFSESKLAATLKARYPSAQIIGCTTAGEISNTGVYDDTLQITAIQWERTTMRVTDIVVSDMRNSFQSGATLGSTLKTDNLRAVLVISDGLSVNGTELLRGFQSVLGTKLPIVGGMAGDGAQFTRTLQLYNDLVSDHLVIAIGLYGNNLVTASGALGGWKPYGPPRKVTRSEKNVVYEVDGKPALPLYRMYIGEHYAKGLPGTGLKFPLAVVGENRNVETVRTLAAINPADNSLTFFGNVAEGETIRLCQASHDRLVEGARGAAKMVSSALPPHALNTPALAICVSCVGRKLVMGEQVSDEIYMVKDTLGPQAAVTGFYSNGEFCPIAAEDSSELHNQTMTIGYLTEVA